MKNKKICFCMAVLICFSSASLFAQPLTMIERPGESFKNQPLSVIFSLPYFKKNPNDPDEVKVDAHITAPSGKKIIMPGFCVSNDKFKGSTWQIRFTPEEKERYKYYIDIDSIVLRKTSSTYEFDVKDSELKGFVRKGKHNPYYLSYDSGEKFFGIGHNVAWVYNNSINVYERYLAKLQESGCNLTRIWISNWSFPLEWKKVGEYDEEEAAKLDKVIQMAEEKGIHVILCLDTYGSFMDEQGSWQEDKWAINPYNSKNGGPCNKPGDFFSDPEAKRFYKNRLRYIVSRWSSYPNIMAFELWNEYNAPKDWVKEMAGYVKTLNPHGQFMTMSLGYPYGEEFDESQIWDLDEIDVVTVHVYGDTSEKGAVSFLMQRSRELSDKYKKPFIVSEFGIDCSKDDKYYDPEGEGTALHNSLWASMVSKSFGTAMNWWWDKYIRPKNLYSHYEALLKFSRDIDWDSKNIEYASTSPVMKDLPKDRYEYYRYKDLTLATLDKWHNIYGSDFEILNNGDVKDEKIPGKYLHGVSKLEMRREHVFEVNYPIKGKFKIRVGVVSQGARLHMFLDGKEKVVKDFPVGAGKGPWKKSLYLDKYDIYQCVYDTDVEIDVPEGEHIIKLLNTGEDWLGIERITLTNYIEGAYANARCLGLVAGDEILCWLQNKDNTWESTFNKKDLEPVKNAFFDVDVEKDGYRVIEWWDTRKGELIQKEQAEVQWKRLRVNVPEFSEDIACKIKMCKRERRRRSR
ncbi:MAG: cellulase family glycosylhydrolase [Candidatus Omnitrophota bacterium]